MGRLCLLSVFVIWASRGTIFPADRYIMCHLDQLFVFFVIRASRGMGFPADWYMLAVCACCLYLSIGVRGALVFQLIVICAPFVLVVVSVTWASRGVGFPARWILLAVCMCCTYLSFAPHRALCFELTGICGPFVYVVCMRRLDLTVDRGPFTSVACICHLGLAGHRASS